MKHMGKIVKVLEPSKTKKPNQDKTPDVFHNELAKQIDDSNSNIKLVAVAPPKPVDNKARLLNQAIYYVANDKPKLARQCLLNIENFWGTRNITSREAKFWVKEESAVQKRHPQERSRYHGKPMPEEFKLKEVH